MLWEDSQSKRATHCRGYKHLLLSPHSYVGNPSAHVTPVVKI
ncbi:MAG: hypothetical protein FJ147_25280 [Deltaproteobacteria bacterium]|nr:hypothetical protein [Deltaproteobacteria bacterium]